MVMGLGDFSRRLSARLDICVRQLGICTWLLCACAAGGAFAQEMPEDAEQVTITAPFINLYTGPGRGYPVFHALEHGETVWLLKRRTDWVKVSTRRGITGWARVSELQDIVDADGEPLAISTPDYRDYQQQSFRLGINYGDFDGADAIGTTLGYRFTENLSAELRLAQAVGSFSDSQIYQVAVVHQPFPRWRFSPYFTLGTGVTITSPNATIIATEDRRDTTMLAGFGVMTYLSRRFALRAEAANHYLLTSRESNQEIIEWKLGIDVFM